MEQIKNIVVIVLFSMFCVSINAQKIDYANLIIPNNQAKQIENTQPKVFLIKVLSVEKRLFCTFMEIALPGYQYASELFPVKNVFDSDIPEGYIDVVEGNYYLMALVKPLTKVNYLMIGDHIPQKDFPRQFVAINMINGKIRPIKPSDLKALSEPIDWSHLGRIPLNMPKAKLCF